MKCSVLILTLICEDEFKSVGHLFPMFGVGCQFTGIRYEKGLVHVKIMEI